MRRIREERSGEDFDIFWRGFRRERIRFEGAEERKKGRERVKISAREREGARREDERGEEREKERERESTTN